VTLGWPAAHDETLTIERLAKALRMEPWELLHPGRESR